MAPAPQESCRCRGGLISTISHHHVAASGLPPALRQAALTVARDVAGYGLEALVSKERLVPQHRIHTCLPRLAIDRPNPTVQITPYLHLDRPEHGGEQPEWRLLIAVAA